MNTALLFAFGAMAAYALLGLLHKQADRIDCRPRQVNLLLFAWSTVFSVVSLLLQGKSIALPTSVLAIAIPSGACAATAILLFQIGVRYGKIASSWLIVNLSAGIPILVSIVLYRERVGAKQAIAIVAMLLCLVFLWLERRQVEESLT